MMVVHDMEQGTEEWFLARRGIPTASNFATIMAKGRDGGASKTRKTYLYKLAGEVITGQAAESFSNSHTERGHVMEDEARKYYEFVKDVEVQKAGFITNGKAGYSPDFLVGDDGLGEIKSKAPHILLEVLEKDKFPPEHWAQCQGGLWVAEREWIDQINYWPNMPTPIFRAYRDEEYIIQIEEAVDRFNDELAALVEKWK